MSTDSSHSPSGYEYVLLLTKANFLKWKMCIKVYLIPCINHVRVIERTKSASSVLVDPAPPTDAKELKSGKYSKRMVMGVIACTAVDMRPGLAHNYKDRSV